MTDDLTATKLIKKKDRPTFLEHREVCVVDRKEVEIRGELGDQLDQGVVDDLEGAAVPARKLASLRWSKKELKQCKKSWLQNKPHKQKG